MPDKEGSDDEKTTKDVVNKKQKQMMNKEEYTIEMVRKIKKIINPKAVFPPIAQNKVKGEIIKGDDLKIDNKNPVKKKMQKNNLDEEGYDIARDMGRVPKTKDKRDASSYPVSKEVRNMKGDTPMQKEFKKKYGKKATALDAVKQKYKGQIMDVKKEELDLSQVAEAFGGYIIVEKLGPGGEFIPDDPDSPFEKGFMKSKEGRRIRKTYRATKAKAIRDIVRARDEDGGTPKQKQTAKDILNKVVGKTDSGGTINVGGAKVSEKDIRDASKIKNPDEFANEKGEVPIKPKQLELPLSKKPRVFSYMRKPSPEAQKKVDAVMRGIKARETLNPDKRSRKRVSASGTEFKTPSKPKVPKFEKTPIKLTKPSDVELPQSFKDFGSKLKSLKADIKQSKNKVKTKTKTKPKTKPLPSPEMIVTKTKSGKVTGDVEPDFVGPKRARSKTATQNRTLQKIRVASRTAKMPVKRLVKPTGSALAKTAKFAGKNPFATLVGASLAKDTFFPAALPKPPTVQGGKVGRRTAG